MHAEFDTRQKLAITARLIARLGLDDATFTHISARADGGFFLPRFGLLFHEITPSNLLKVAYDGTILEGQETIYNPTGYNSHIPVYQMRPEINAIFHLHTNYSIAVSTMECGLLPLSQHALHFYDAVSYHDYDSLILDVNIQSNRLLQDLKNNNILFMRSHGILICGKTIHECYFYLHHLERACKIQCLALASGQKLIMPDIDICHKAMLDLTSFEADIGRRDWEAAARFINLASF